MSEEQRIGVFSEVGPLEAVLLHRPGPEIESMTPATAKDLLYNEIIPMGAVSREYETFSRVLSSEAEVLDVGTEAALALGDTDLRSSFIEAIAMEPDATARRRELHGLSPEDLVRAVIQGLPKRADTLERYLTDRPYDIAPLPNLYFTRDAGAIVGSFVIAGAMAHGVRRNEALLARAALSRHSREADNLVFDGTAREDPAVTLEGGDILVAGDRVLLVGLSERTTPRAVDELVQGLVARSGQPWRLYAVLLPKSRATIHLDMVVTFVDRGAVLCFEPLVVGPRAAPVIRMEASPGTDTVLESLDSLHQALSRDGIVDEFIPCGGRDEITATREQWLAGTNVFARGPGDIVALDCNPATLTALAAHGFSIVPAAGYLSSPGEPRRRRRAVTIPGTELARGGGGMRCMTMPLRRRG